MAIAFYITIFTMMNIRPRWKWLVLPSFIIWVASDMWIAYMHVHNIDAQKIQTIKTIFMIQAILMFLMIFEASLWKIMTAIMMCDFVCGLPFVIVTGKWENCFKNRTRSAVSSLWGGYKFPFVPADI